MDLVVRSLLVASLAPQTSVYGRVGDYLVRCLVPPSRFFNPINKCVWTSGGLYLVRCLSRLFCHVMLVLFPLSIHRFDPINKSIWTSGGTPC